MTLLCVGKAGAVNDTWDILKCSHMNVTQAKVLMNECMLREKERERNYGRNKITQVTACLLLTYIHAFMITVCPLEENTPFIKVVLNWFCLSYIYNNGLSLFNAQFISLFKDEDLKPVDTGILMASKWQMRLSFFCRKQKERLTSCFPFNGSEGDGRRRAKMDQNK